MTVEGALSATEPVATPVAPEGDRKFRPDVEGLRAVAIGLVVVFHMGVTQVSGGFVGVDVFFVISGFLITGLLVKERESTGGTSIAGFYARRARRILPAAPIVLIVTVVASYHWLGFLTGGSIATDGQWAAVFSANIHFAAIGAQYLGAQAPPSPLQHFWSLSVEEQFYVVWPITILLIGLASRRGVLRKRLVVVLGLMIAASFAWSMVETHQNGTVAYFSPFTRAWELGLGALVAVAIPWARTLPKRIGIVTSWIGAGMIIYSAITFTQATSFPGSAASIPVGGAALVILGGTAAPAALGAEMILRLPPFQWLGRISYSLYLWHWPLMIIAAENQGKTLTVGENLKWVALALVLSIATFFIVEQPIRRAPFLVQSTLWSLAMGAALIAMSFCVMAYELSA